MRASLIAFSALAACTADQPVLSDAMHTLDGTCVGPNADHVIDFFPSSLANPNAALGAPDGTSVALAANDVITVGFTGLGAITDAPGNDLRIHATVPVGASALVRVAALDQQYQYAGTLDENTREFDIGVAMLVSIQYVRVVDVSGAISVDAFEAIHDHCH
jgi:hypothetical protein